MSLRHGSAVLVSVWHPLLHVSCRRPAAGFFLNSPANCGHCKTREINGTLFPHCGHHETIICWMRVNTRQNTKVTKAQAFRKQEGHRDASCGNRPNLTSVKQPKCSTWKSKRQRSGIMNDESVAVWYVRNFGLPSGRLSRNYGKSPFFMGKSTMSMAIFNSLLYVYQAGYIPLTVPTTYHFSTPSRCLPWTEPLSATDQRNCEKRVPCGERLGKPSSIPNFTIIGWYKTSKWVVYDCFTNITYYSLWNIYIYIMDYAELYWKTAILN